MTRMLRAALVLMLAGTAGGCRDDARAPLRFWAMGREGEVVRDLVKDFERETGIRVEVQQIPWSAAHEKLLTAYVGRSTPDVAQLGNTWISEFTALHALDPLDARVASSTALTRESFFPGIWDTNVLDGTTWGIPWYVDTRVLFYRRDLLARAGYDSIPGTWEAWRTCMRAIKRQAGEQKYAIFLPTNEWTVPVLLGLQAGSPLLDDEGTRGAFSAPEFRRAFDFFIALFRESLAPPLSGTQIANLYQEFERGYFSMYVTGPWNVGEFKNRLPANMQRSWATAPMPGPEGGASRVSLAGGSSLVLFSASRRHDDAWKLIEFLSRPDQQIRFYHACGDLPARREAWRDTSLTNDAPMRAFGEQLERVVPTPKVPEWEQIAIRLQSTIESVVRGATSADSALTALDRDVNQMLEKRRWLMEKRRAAPPAAAQPAGGTP